MYFISLERRPLDCLYEHEYQFKQSYRAIWPSVGKKWQFRKTNRNTKLLLQEQTQKQSAVVVQ